MNMLNNQVNQQRNSPLAAMDTADTMPEFKTANEIYTYVLFFFERYFPDIKKTSVPITEEEEEEMEKRKRTNKENKKKIDFAHKVNAYRRGYLSDEIIYGMRQIQNAADIQRVVDQWKQQTSAMLKRKNPPGTAGSSEPELSIYEKVIPIFKEYADHEDQYVKKIAEIANQRATRTEEILSIDDIVQKHIKEAAKDTIDKFNARLASLEKARLEGTSGAVVSPGGLPLTSQSRIPSYAAYAANRSKLIGAPGDTIAVQGSETPPIQTVEFVSLDGNSAVSSSSAAGSRPNVAPSRDIVPGSGFPTLQQAQDLFDAQKAKTITSDVNANAAAIVKYFEDLVQLNLDLANAMYRALRFPPLIYNVDDVFFTSDWENLFVVQFNDMITELRASDSYDGNSSLPTSYDFFVTHFDDDATIGKAQSLFSVYIGCNMAQFGLMGDSAENEMRATSTPYVINGQKRKAINALLQFLQSWEIQMSIDGKMFSEEAKRIKLI